ncbi:MAG: hypothetical protein HKN87_01825 [Saprospiraceae bacterium]|nr:hypothetical protein [Saprospiraceae bacterium]
MRFDKNTSPLYPQRANISDSIADVDVKKYLIVPIFFRRQIEKVLEAHMPHQGFGFFFGTSENNYRIIKKIWPVKIASGWQNQIKGEDLRQAKLLAEESNLQLLGCFHNGPLVQFLDGDNLKILTSDSFSNVRINMKEGKTHFWNSGLIEGPNLFSSPEVVIL